MFHTIQITGECIAHPFDAGLFPCGRQFSHPVHSDCCDTDRAGADSRPVTAVCLPPAVGKCGSAEGGKYPVHNFSLCKRHSFIRQPISHNQKDFSKGLRCFRCKQVNRFFIQMREIHMRGKCPEAFPAYRKDNLIQRFNIRFLFTKFR